jgi:hypothetical protein
MVFSQSSRGMMLTLRRRPATKQLPLKRLTELKVYCYWLYLLHVSALGI